MFRKNIIIVSVLLALLTFGFLGENEKSIAWKEFNQGIELAKKEKKYMIVDFYTDWCGWCKKMDKDTYADADIQRLLGSSFIAVKLNAEAENKTITFEGKIYTNMEFTQYLGINGFPTTVFFDTEGKAITKVPGFIDKTKMVQVLNYFSSESYKKISFADFVVKN